MYKGKLSLPALFGDDHFGVMAVEFEPECSITEVNLRLGAHEAGVRG